MRCPALRFYLPASGPGPVVHQSPRPDDGSFIACASCATAPHAQRDAARSTSRSCSGNGRFWRSGTRCRNSSRDESPGDPRDDRQDLDLPHWVGVLPLTTCAGAPRPRPTCPPSIAPAVRPAPRPRAGPTLRGLADEVAALAVIARARAAAPPITERQREEAQRLQIRWAHSQRRRSRHVDRRRCSSDLVTVVGRATYLSATSRLRCRLH